MVVREHFNLLFTTECHLSRPTISGKTLTIIVDRLGLMEGHPLRPNDMESLFFLKSCRFVFKDVESSTRLLTPYVGDSRLGKFGPNVSEVDGPFGISATAHEYGFEGLYDNKSAWVDWTVRAGSFTLETCDN
jgi:hypothetical protein